MAGAKTVIVAEVGDWQRRAMAHDGAPLMRRRHCVAVATDDPAVAEIVERTVRGGVAVRNREFPALATRRADVVAQRLSEPDTARVARMHPEITRRETVLLVASHRREAVDAVIAAVRAGNEVNTEARQPYAIIPPSVVVLSESERRALLPTHPHLRRTRAAVAVAYPSAAALAAHVHLEVAASHLAGDAHPDVVAVAPTEAERTELRRRHRELVNHPEMTIFAGGEVTEPLHVARVMRQAARFRDRLHDVQNTQMPPSRDGVA